MTQLNRRDVLKMGAVLGGSLVTGAYTAVAQQPQRQRSATDWVKLGNSDIRVPVWPLAPVAGAEGSNASLARKSSPVWYVMLTIVASGSLNQPTATGKCTKCWQRR